MSDPRQELREKLTGQGLINLSGVEEKIFDEIIDEYAEHERKEAYEAGYQQGRVDEESKRYAEPNPQADNTKPETERRRAGIGENDGS